MKAWHVIAGTPVVAAWAGIIWWAVISPKVVSRKERQRRRQRKAALRAMGEHR